MKAVVAEIKGKYAVVMNKKGEFFKIKNNGRLNVGYEVDIPDNAFVKAGFAVKAASVAAAFLLVLGVGVGVYSYNLPYSYIEIDINPCIEITTNIYDRIIKVEGMNDDGKDIVSSVPLVNKKLGEGIEILLDTATEKGYLKPEAANTVVFTVAGKNEKKVAEIQKKLENTVDSEIIKSEAGAPEVVLEKTTPEKVESAKKIGISAGKFTLIQRLIEAKPELKVDDLKDLPVKDILESIKEVKKKLEATRKNSENGKEGKTEDKEKGKAEEKKNNRDSLKKSKVAVVGFSSLFGKQEDGKENGTLNKNRNTKDEKEKKKEDNDSEGKKEDTGYNNKDKNQNGSAKIGGNEEEKRGSGYFFGSLWNKNSKEGDEEKKNKDSDDKISGSGNRSGVSGDKYGNKDSNKYGTKNGNEKNNKSGDRNNNKNNSKNNQKGGKLNRLR